MVDLSLDLERLRSRDFDRFRDRDLLFRLLSRSRDLDRRSRDLRLLSRLFRRRLSGDLDRERDFRFGGWFTVGGGANMPGQNGIGGIPKLIFRIKLWVL